MSDDQCDLRLLVLWSDMASCMFSSWGIILGPPTVLEQRWSCITYHGTLMLSSTLPLSCKYILRRCVCMPSHFCHVQLFATLWTIACQTPLSVRFSRQDYWSGLPCPPPGDLSDAGIEPSFNCLQCRRCRFFTAEPPGFTIPRECGAKYLVSWKQNSSFQSYPFSVRRQRTEIISQLCAMKEPNTDKSN